MRLNIPKRTEKNYPLLRTLNEAIVITLDELTQENNLDATNEISTGDDSSNRQGSSQQNKPSKGTALVLRKSLLLLSLSLFVVVVVLGKL